MFGYLKHEVLGQSHYELVTPADLISEAKETRPVLRTKTFLCEADVGMMVTTAADPVQVGVLSFK